MGFRVWGFGITIRVPESMGCMQGLGVRVWALGLKC